MKNIINTNWIKFDIIKKEIIILIVFIVIIFFFVGCSRKRPSPNRYLNRNVSNSELTGIWKVSDSTLKNLKKEGYKKYVNKDDHQLILKNDMTCEISAFSYIPNFPTPQDEKQYYINKQHGIWKIIRTKEFSGENNNKDIQMVEIENGFGIRFFLAEIDKKLILWNYIGDPDYLKYYDFIKEGE